MKVWSFNQYGMLPQHGPMSRTYQFAKHLNEAGHETIAFVASHPHNTPHQFAEKNKKYCLSNECDFPWVFIRTCNYEDGKPFSKIRRLYSLLEYFFGLFSVTKKFEKPDVIIGSSAPPFTSLAAILLAKKYNCKAIVEIRDLWPESIVAYGLLSKKNPVIKLMYALEKWLYTKADAVVFTMEGGREYVVKSGWDTEHGGTVDLGKLYHINNGVNLKEYVNNREQYILEDPDLDDENTYRVIYTGSIRKANRSILILPEVAKELSLRSDKKINILIYGRGNYVDELVNECEKKGIKNLKYKGNVSKLYVPYILSKSHVNILNCSSTAMSKYGSSQNKLFEYLASGKPIISGENDKYSVIINRNCGISREFDNAGEIADAIIELIENSSRYENIADVAKEYDFGVLSQKLIKIMESI